jgi:hypothetical protein
MISRSTLVGALVVVELAILGVAAKAVGGHASAHWNFSPSDSPPVVSKLDKTFDTGPSPHVVIDVDQANVSVQAGAAAGVHVAGTMRVSGRTSGATPSLTAVRTADGVRVSVESGLVHVRHGRLEREVRLTVPPGADVEIASAGSVTASGLRAKLVARLADGSVHVANHRGDLDVTTASGDIDLLDVHSAALTARTDDGALKLTSSGADHIDAHTDSGAITAIGLRAVDGQLATDDGAVDVSFAPESDATVSLHTADGHIIGAGPAAVGDDSSGGTRSLQLGSARGTFTVSTDSGSITVSQGAKV